ncbi:MAG: hypothetical protein WC080_03005 [Patescibacteria group bacterium]
MAKASSKSELGVLFNPVSLSLLALLLLVLDVVANQMWGNPIETLTIGFSGILFGLSLGYLMLGSKRFNHSLGVFLAIIYVLVFVILYTTKYISI